MNNRVQAGLAEKGLNPQGKKFESPQEQQQFIQRLEEEKRKLVPDDLDRSLKTSFKSKGRVWAEATLEKDREMFNLDYIKKEELKDKLISGRYFREYVIKDDTYTIDSWSAKNTFFSKETGSQLPQKGEYVGRLHFMTPAEVEAKYGHEIDSKTLKEMLGGNDKWRSFAAQGSFTGS